MWPSMRPGMRNRPWRSTDTVDAPANGATSGVAADEDDPSVADRERLGARPASIGREEDTAFVDAVGWAVDRRRNVRNRSDQKQGQRAASNRSHTADVMSKQHGRAGVS